MRFTLIFLISLLSFQCEVFSQKTEFKVMAWNILRSGNQIENGVDIVSDIIKEINPDVVLMVETYGSGPYIAKKNGYNFHLVAKEGTALDDKSVNLSIYSKFPFGERIDTEYPFFLGGIEILINNKKVRFFSNWFHYQLIVKPVRKKSNLLVINKNFNSSQKERIFSINSFTKWEL